MHNRLLPPQRKLHLNRAKTLLIVNTPIKSIYVFLRHNLIRSERIHTNDIHMRFTIEINPSPVFFYLICDKTRRSTRNKIEHEVGFPSTGASPTRNTPALKKRTKHGNFLAYHNKPLIPDIIHRDVYYGEKDGRITSKKVSKINTQPRIGTPL